MTGYENYNFEEFNAAENYLKTLLWDVENPADHGLVDGAVWSDYLRYDIAVLSRCSAIYLLRGWEKSKGARLEREIAQTLEMHIIYQPAVEFVVQ